MGKVKNKYYGAVKHCIFYDCVSDSRYDRPGFNANTTFYRFPKPCLEFRRNGEEPSLHLRKCNHCSHVDKWVKQCNSKSLNCISKITKDTYICDKHFSYKFVDLKKVNIASVIPRSFLEIKQKKSEHLEDGITSTNPVFVHNEVMEESHDPLALATTCACLEKGSQTNFMTSRKDVATQTTFPVEDEVMLQNEIKHLRELNKNLTDNASPKNAICRFEDQIKTNDKMFAGETPVRYWKSARPQVERRKTQWTFMQEIILTLVRLRMGLLEQDLGYRFAVSNSYVSKIVITWVQIMYQRFNSIRPSMFPPRSVISEHLPSVFKRLKNIRVIIDCAEIFCESPKNFEQQGNLYSRYKAHTTFKVLIGCTPSGAVSFVSDLFEGSISDREIVKQSKLMDLLDEGDLILADRGFTIKDLTDEKNVELNIPAFLKGRSRLTAEEEIQTKFIARQRIYVEHVVGRLKRFRLLKKIIPLTMRGIINQITFVCACLLNFEQPYIK